MQKVSLALAIKFASAAKASLWADETSDKKCQNSDEYPGVDTLQECQTKCGKGCIGVSYSSIPGERLCYACKDDALSANINNYSFYRKANLAERRLQEPVTWEIITASGGAPSARNRHTAIYANVSNKMYIFGGLYSYYMDGFVSRSLNDVWALDVVRSSWSPISTTGRPPARYDHTAIYVQSGTESSCCTNKMYIFGGVGPSKAKLNDVWALNLADNSWSLITTTDDINLGPGTSLAVPSARNGHTAIYAGTLDKMFIFGGDAGRIVNDVWSLDLAMGNNYTWSAITTSGALPSRSEERL